MKPKGTGEDRIIVFVKAPVPGAVKTRLCPPLSPQQAASLYAAFVGDTIETVRTAAHAAVCYAAADGFPDLSWLKDGAGLPFYLQRGDDLGAKLQACFGEVFSSGARRAVAIGSDTPHLEARALTEAFALLGRNDLVLGPATDGGYYLIGLNATADYLFEDIPWSTPQVFSQTLSRAKRHRLRVGLLQELFDVDTPADLRKLAARSHGANTAAFTALALQSLREQGVLV